jgi:hypothetical protein
MCEVLGVGELALRVTVSAADDAASTMRTRVLQQHALFTSQVRASALFLALLKVFG